LRRARLAIHGPKPGTACKPVTIVLDNGPIHSSKATRAAPAECRHWLTPGMEACATAHHWARELIALGHDVRLMPPAYVKAYVKRNKKDAADAEAICEAVTRPSMRFVPVKDTDQQSVLMLHLRQAVSPTSVQAQEVHGILTGCAHRQPA
jgi:transposase